MKYISIHPAIVLLAALLACGLMESLPAATRATRASITNASGRAMPIERKQKSRYYGRFTAIAKSGYTFAVKNNRIIYMSKERAISCGAKQFDASHKAREAVTPTSKNKKSRGATGL